MNNFTRNPITLHPDVVCVGQAVIDCITRGREADTSQPNAAKASKLAYRAEDIRLNTGGDAVNESFHLAAMGHSVRLVCGIGNDLAGNILLTEAKNRKIDTSCITVSKTLRTPIANLIVQKDGSRYSINSSATRLEGYRPSPEALSGARIVSLASLFRAPLDSPSVIRSLIQTAHENGAIVCCDTKLPTFRKIELEELVDVWPLIDYLFPNEKEAAYYTGEDTFPAMAAKLRNWGVKNVIIKTGPQGCYAHLQEGCFTLPALPVTVVDSTGAGDSFVSGFLSGLLRQKSPQECLNLGLEEAANCVQHMGA